MSRFTEKRRLWLYRVLIAAAPLLVINGIVTPEEASLWGDLAGAILLIGGGSLAAANITPEQPDE